MNDVTREASIDESKEFVELAELELALVGGGSGDVVVCFTR